MIEITSLNKKEASKGFGKAQKPAVNRLMEEIKRIPNNLIIKLLNNTLRAMTFEQPDQGPKLLQDTKKLFFKSQIIRIIMPRKKRIPTPQNTKSKQRFFSQSATLISKIIFWGYTSQYPKKILLFAFIYVEIFFLLMCSLTIFYSWAQNIIHIN